MRRLPSPPVLPPRSQLPAQPPRAPTPNPEPKPNSRSTVASSGDIDEAQSTRGTFGNSSKDSASNRWNVGWGGVCPGQGGDVGGAVRKEGERRVEERWGEGNPHSQFRVVLVGRRGWITSRRVLVCMCVCVRNGRGSVPESITGPLPESRRRPPRCPLQKTPTHPAPRQLEIGREGEGEVNGWPVSPAADDSGRGGAGRASRQPCFISQHPPPRKESQTTAHVFSHPKTDQANISQHGPKYDRHAVDNMNLRFNLAKQCG